MKHFKQIIANILFWGGLGVLILLFVNPAALALLVAGFRSEGDTVDFLETLAAEQEVACALPWPVSQTAASHYPPAALDTIQVAHWSLPGGTAGFGTGELVVERLESGRTSNGQPLIYAEYTERGLNEVWQQRLSVYSQPKPELAARVQNARVDLKSGAVIIYADVDMGTKWQEVGIVLTMAEADLQFAVSGVDVGGEYLTPPAAGPVAELVDRLEANLNEILGSARLVDATGPLAAQHLAIHEDRLQILAGDETMLPLAPICPIEWSRPSPTNQTQSPPTRRLNTVQVRHWALPDQQLVFEVDRLGTRRLEQGQTEAGRPAYYAEIGEAALNQLWQEELNQYANADPELMARIRDPWVELEPEAVIIQAAVDTGARWQQVGIILTLADTTPQFEITGVDLDGRLYTTPTDSPISELVTRIEENINEVLRSARLVDPQGTELPLHSLTIEADRLLVLVRN